MGFFNFATKLGYKSSAMLNHAISHVYNPAKDIVHTLHKGANYVDELLDRSSKFGVPSSFIDLIKQDLLGPAFGIIRTADDLLSQDLPALFKTGKSIAKLSGASAGREGITGAKFIPTPGIPTRDHRRLVTPTTMFGQAPPSQARGAASFSRVPSSAAAF